MTSIHKNHHPPSLGVGSSQVGDGRLPPSADDYIEKILRRYVWQALDFDMLDSAEFTMEKLLAIDPSNLDSKHLMGLIFYRQRRYKAAANMTNVSSSPSTSTANNLPNSNPNSNNGSRNHLGCVYIYAQSCLKLKMYNEGIAALENTRNDWSSSSSSTTTINGSRGVKKCSQSDRWIIPDSEILNSILGKLYHLQGDKLNAIKAYAASAKINPFLWDQVESLCRLGVNLQVSNLYRLELLDDQGFPYVSSIAASSSDQDPFTTPIGHVTSNTTNTTATTVTNPAATSAFSSSLTTSVNSLPFTFKTSQQFLKNSTAAAAAAAAVKPLGVEDSQRTPAGPLAGSAGLVVSGISNGLSSDSYSTPSDTRSSRFQQSGLPLAPQKRMVRNASMLSSTSSSSTAADPKPTLAFPDFPRRSARLAHTVQKRNFVTPSIRSSQSRVQMQQPQLLQPQQAQSQSQSQLPSQLQSKPLLQVQPPQLQSQPHQPPQSGSTTALGALKRSRLRDSTARKEAQIYIVSLYRKITAGYIAFCKYQCRQAINYFEQLPDAQKSTPWVLSKLGRSHFEMVNYRESEKFFEKLRDADRCRIKDMEYYSTLLWHLRKDVELSFLAHELMDVDRNSSQAWCTLGNSFSLKRETAQSLKCFKRAIHIDPDSPYAYTLLAHEQVATEAYENAQESFRLAIRADNRHYNAWYGLGMVFMRLGNLELAELHFSRAAVINPTNVVLICCIGMVLEKKGLPGLALEQYKKACDIQPNSALSRYKKARALIQLKLYNAALVEFDHLQTLAPDEASVHFLLGQLYKILQNRDLAVKHFTIALNLDPKGSSLIKEALEGLNIFNPGASP